MSRWFFACVVALGTLTGAARPAAAQLPPDKALASMTVADGLKVELFAHEPMLLNPTSMDVDHLGRVWVCEAVNYRCFLRNRPLYRDAGDRIVVLADKDGDGKADDSSVFYQGKELIAPLGIAVAKTATGPAYKVFVCQSPDILLFHDTDGDGKADGPPEKFLTGFNGFDHDHGVHSILIGPDGKLYFTVGDAGVKGLQAKDGKGPKFTSNTTDCRAGTVWRCDFDGANLELIAHNFRNNYECCVDSFGEVWLSDNDDDGNQQTRICHVMPGGNYGYHPRGPGQTHWHEEQPGVVHKALRTGFGSPTGICFYEGGLLPEKYRGHLLHTDAGPRELRAFHRKPKGAGYEVDKTVILTSSDNWFRPADVCVGPDGSVFVADWYDPGVGGHGMGDTTRGRVYRVTPKGHTGYKVPEVKLDTETGIFAALASPCIATRTLGIAGIHGRPKAEALALVRTFSGHAENEFAAARAHAQSTAFSVKGKLPSGMLRWARWEVRIRDQFSQQFIRLIRQRGTYVAYGTNLEKKSPGELREYAIDMGYQPVHMYLTAYFYQLAKFYDGKDHVYRAALNIACGTDPARRDAILADFDKHFPEWNDAVADLVWELRPKSVLPRLAKLMDDPKLTDVQKGRIVDILAVNDDPAAGQTMLALLMGNQPGEVRARAVENLRLFLPTKWQALRRGDELPAAIAKLLKTPGDRIGGLWLAAVAPDCCQFEDVIAITRDPKVRLAVRREAVATCGKIRNVRLTAALKGLAEDPELGGAAVSALGAQVAGQGNDPVSKEALATLQGFVVRKDAPSEVKTAAVAALAGSRVGTGWLLALKERGGFPDALAADAGKLLRNSPFQGERNKALLLFPAPGKLDIKKLPSLAELAKRKGDPANGQQLIAKSLTGEAQCLKCHTVRGVGGQIGPDLSMVGKKGSREDLFKSILQPSAAIADQSVSWKIDTTDGQSITGLLVQETPKAVVLRDANGKDYEIPVGDIEKRTKSLVSLMPDNLAAALTEDELIDVVEYLTTLQTAALTPDYWHVAGPFDAADDAALDAATDVEKRAFDPAAKFPGKGGTAVGWRAVRLTATGYLDLAALHAGQSPQSLSYLARTVESPVAQEATILLGTDDGCRLWVNGEKVFGHERHEAAAPERDRVKVALKPGANTILLKVNNGNNPHGVYLTILSGQELKAK